MRYLYLICTLLCCLIADAQRIQFKNKDTGFSKKYRLPLNIKVQLKDKFILVNNDSVFPVFKIKVLNIIGDSLLVMDKVTGDTGKLAIATIRALNVRLNAKDLWLGVSGMYFVGIGFVSSIALTITSIQLNDYISLLFVPVSASLVYPGFYLLRSANRMFNPEEYEFNFRKK